MKKFWTIACCAALVLLLALAMPQKASAATTTSGKCGDNLTWELKDDTLIISGTGPMWDYCYEDDERSIWSYGYFPAFNKVVINEGVTTIGNDAFYELRITDIAIAESVTSIGEKAFYKCTRLTSVTIPDNVSHIGEYAFTDCKSVNSMTLGKGVTHIARYAFLRCEGLTGVTIPDGIVQIGHGAFSNCSKLTSIILPDTLTKIDEGAFSFCTGLKNISLPAGVTSIEGSAFYGCKNMTQIVIPDGVTTIGDHAFYFCPTLASITIPDSVTSIGAYAFGQCAVVSITIPDGVTRIEEGLLCHNPAMTSVILPDSITTIDRIAFYNSPKLTNITLPKGVTSIGESAFKNCTGLTAITIPDSVVHIDEDAFLGCTALADVYYASTKKVFFSIAMGEGNSPLTSANIHYTEPANYGTCGADLVWELAESGSLIISGTGPMYDFEAGFKTTAPWYEISDKILSIMIQDQVTSIGDNAFYGCTNLSSIEFFSPIISVGDDAFNACNKLDSIYYSGAAEAFAQINVGHGNDCFVGAKVCFVGQNNRIVLTASNSAANRGCVYLSWNGQNASLYSIYRRTYTNGVPGKWEKIATTNGKTHFEKTVVNNVRYGYAIGSMQEGGKEELSAEVVITYLPTPTGMTVNTPSGIQINWKNKGVEDVQYIVRRLEQKDNQWTATVLAQVTGTTYTDRTAVEGVVYRYTIQAVKGEEQSGLSLEMSGLYLSVPELTVTNQTEGVKLAWEANAYAETYQIYRSAYYENGNPRPWGEPYATVGADVLEYLDTDVVNGVRYRYTVQVQYKWNTSGYKDSACLYRMESTGITKMVNNISNIKISWNASTTASKYAVYRSEMVGDVWSGWKCLTYVQKPNVSYVDYNVTNGTMYRYKIVCVKGTDRSGGCVSDAILKLGNTSFTASVLNGSMQLAIKANPYAKTYEIQRREVLDQENNVYSEWETVVAETASLSHRDRTICRRTTYEYRVIARNDDYVCYGKAYKIVVK